MKKVRRKPVEYRADDDQHRAKEEDYWRSQNRWQRITGIAAIAAFTATAVYATLTYCLLSTSQRQLTQQILIGRPVVIGHKVQVVDRNNGAPIKVRIEFVNFGQSTSPKVVAVGHIIPDAPNHIPIDKSCEKRDEWPEGSDIGRTPLAGVVGDNSNSPNCREHINCGQWDWSMAEGTLFDPATQRLYVSGCVRYLGLDGHLWFTKFCDYWAGESKFFACPDENSNQIY